MSEQQVSGNAIKLKNVGIYSVNQNSGLCGIAINNQSTIEEPSAAEVFFDKIERGFPDDNEVDDLVDVKGVVDTTSCNIEMKNFYGANKRMMEDVYLCDPTGEIFITLWEDHIDYVQEQIENGCTSLAFHCIHLKQFGKKVYLTSISSTVITTVDAIAITSCEKKVSNAAEDLDLKEKTIFVEDFHLVSGFCKFFICQSCDKKG